MPRDTKAVKEAKELQRSAGEQLAKANKILKDEKQKKEEKKVLKKAKK